LAAIKHARATVRERVWKMAGQDAPDFGVSSDRPLVIDLDATLITDGAPVGGQAWSWIVMA